MNREAITAPKEPSEPAHTVAALPTVNAAISSNSMRRRGTEPVSTVISGGTDDDAEGVHRNDRAGFGFAAAEVRRDVRQQAHGDELRDADAEERRRTAATTQLRRASDTSWRGTGRRCDENDCA